MWIEISAAGGFLGLTGLILRLQNRRVETLESQWKKSLYAEDGTTKFMPRSTCERHQAKMCDDLAALTELMRSMDQKREQAKDEAHNQNSLISERLASIESKLDRNNGDRR